MGTAYLLLGHGNVIRVEPVVAPGTFQLDSASAIERLRGLGESEAREAKPHLASFFEQPAETFIPHHALPTSGVTKRPDET